LPSINTNLNLTTQSKMGLVDYSDSDTSDVEHKLVTKPSVLTSKTTFQKVVDRSNPGKIRVALPQPATSKEPNDEGPPTKRAKTGGGAFSGFNSFLPPPKRTGQANITLGGGSTTKKGGLGVGVNLKTGAAPGFSRDPEPERDYVDDAETNSSNNSVGTSLGPPKLSAIEAQIPAEQVKLVGKPLMFRPLSVANKPAKKKKQANSSNPTIVTTPKTPTTPKTEKPVPPRAKISLFSMAAEPDKLPTSTTDGEYKPMIIEPDVDEANADALDSSFTPSYEDYTPTTSFSAPPPAPTPPVSQSLDDIAGDLRLSAAERRQLFGRQKGARGQAATNVINFNTDQEYLHNEELRAAGEQVAHNPVRAIAPGKHSLKQLVNAAQSQKEALEESFAKGKSNRAEASSRYGW
jgi:hypothetical protein